MISFFLGFTAFIFLADAVSVLRLPGTETGNQIMEYLREDTGHPAGGAAYIVLGLALVLAARHVNSGIYSPLYAIGGLMSFLGVRFFETGFARRFYQNWVFDGNPWKRRILCTTEASCGIYMAFLAAVVTV